MSPRQRRRQRKEGPAKLSTAEFTVRAWLDAWRRRDFPSMTVQCQATWIKVNREFVRSPSGWLQDAFGGKELLRADIIRVSQNGAVAHADVRISYRSAGQVRRGRLRLKVICEDAPYKPSPTGVWGVNPTTALSERPI